VSLFAWLVLIASTLFGAALIRQLGR